LEETPQDGIAADVGDGLQFIERRMGLEGQEIGLREVEGSQLGHLIGSGIVHAADQHTDVTDQVLLDSGGCLILPSKW